MSEYVIRQATENDAELVSALIKEAMATYASDSHIPQNRLESLTESTETVKDRIRHSNCLCVWDDKTPVGTITLSIVNNPMKYSFTDKSEDYLRHYTKVGYISRFAVKDELRKTGQGIILINEAVKNAEANLCDLVLLHTSVENPALVAFYRNRGFALIDSEHSRGYERGLLGLPLIVSE